MYSDMLKDKHTESIEYNSHTCFHTLLASLTLCHKFNFLSKQNLNRSRRQKTAITNRAYINACPTIAPLMHVIIHILDLQV